MDFFNEILNKLDKNEKVSIPWRTQGLLLFFHLKPMINLWLRNNMSQDTGYLIKTPILEFIRKQPGFLSMYVVCKINGHSYRCVVFESRQAPEELVELLTKQQNTPDSWLKPKEKKYGSFLERRKRTAS